MKYAQHDYQRYVTDRIVRQKRIAVFLDMGLGKTSCALKAIDELIYDRFEVDKVLVISPLKVAKLTWEEEVRKWDDFRHLRISKCVGMERERIAALEAPADIYVINRENTVWLLRYMAEMKRWPFQMMVIDESSSYKNRSSKRWKAAVSMARITPRVVELTGTPAPNGLLDLWAQIYLLDGGERLGKTLTVYRDVYFMPDKRSAYQVFSWKPRPGADKRIQERIRDIAVSMTAKDYLSLPDRIDNRITVTMPPAVRKTYAKMEKDYLVTIDEETVTASSAGVVANKLLQMANGAVYAEDGTWVEFHDLKLRALAELVEQNEGKPIMVFYQYQHDLERLKSYFADFHPRELRTEEDKRDWDSGEIPMLLVHPASAGHGLNLQAGGSVIAWFGMTWNLEQYQQANARLYRQGQKRTVIVHHIVCEGTMDESAMARLEKKARTQDDLIEAVKARIRNAKEAS